MKKYLLLTFLLLSTSLNASMLLGDLNICIDQFYTKDGSFYYQRSSDSSWYVSTNNYTSSIVPNFIFDSNTSQCNPNASYVLGMRVEDYNMLLALSGLLIGFALYFTLLLLIPRIGGR